MDGFDEPALDDPLESPHSPSTSPLISVNYRTAPLSLSLITGLPGSGKSTLLQRIVTAPDFPAAQTALIINDTSPLQLSARSFRNRALEVEALARGCACCTGSDEMNRTLLRFAKDFRIKHVWLEASGLALTEKLIEPLKGPSLSKWISLRQIIHLVDAGNFFTPSNSLEIHAPQVIPADSLLLNKIDTTSPETLDKVRVVVKSWNPRASLYESAHCEINPIPG